MPARLWCPTTASSGWPTNGTAVTPPPTPGGELALTGAEGSVGPIFLGALLLLVGVVALGIHHRVAGSRTRD